MVVMDPLEETESVTVVGDLHGSFGDMQAILEVAPTSHAGHMRALISVHKTL